MLFIVVRSPNIRIESHPTVCSRKTGDNVAVKVDLASVCIERCRESECKPLQMLPCKSSNRELNWKVPFRMFTQLERVWSSPWHQRLQEVLHTFIGHDHGMYPLQFSSQQEWQLAEKGNKLPGPKHCVETGPWTILYTYGSKMFKGSVSLLKMLKRYCMLLHVIAIIWFHRKIGIHQVELI